MGVLLGAGAAAAGGATSALSAIGTVVSAVGSIVGAIGAANAANYQAEVAAQNQRIAEENARMASVAGQQELYAQGQKTRAAIGSAKAQLAGAGVDVNTGTAAGLAEAMAAMGMLDSLTTRHNTALDVRGWKVQGLNYGAQSQMAKMQAQSAMVGGIFNAASSFLGGASQIVSQQNRNNLATGSPMNFGMSRFA